MTTNNRHTNIVAAYLIPQKDGQILLSKRQNTGYRDGFYSLIAGHLEPGENFTTCIIREAKEEAGITISLQDLLPPHIMHRKSVDNDSERVDVFFPVNKWKGQIKNLEPHKCAQLKWFDINRLPTKTIPCVKYAITSLQNQIFYSEFGW